VPHDEIAESSRLKDYERFVFDVQVMLAECWNHDLLDVEAGDNKMQLAIELPNDFMALEKEHEVEREVRLSYALRLYKQARVTISKAAELAGLDLYRFMELCSEEQIPVIDMSPEELQQELEGLKLL